GFGRVRPLVSDVVGERTAEDRRVRSDDADRAPHARGVALAKLLSVDQYLSAARLPELEKQIHERRLARARRADERRHRARLESEAHAAQHLPILGIAEVHVAQLDAARPGSQRHVASLDTAGPQQTQRALE